MRVSQVYLSLGSNQGDKVQYLQAALQLLADNEAIQIVKVSQMYETSPVGGVKQDDFLNIAAQIDTQLTPHALLAYINEVEQKLDRQRIIRWGPRTIDIDILFFDEEVIQDEQLIIPHKELFNRLFVLVPLTEICSPDFYQWEKMQAATAQLVETEQAIQVWEETK